jgi:hypothetical protein
MEDLELEPEDMINDGDQIYKTHVPLFLLGTHI